MNTCALQYSVYGMRDAAQNWEEELALILSDLKLTRGIACSRVWQGCIKGEMSWQLCGLREEWKNLELCHQVGRDGITRRTRDMSGRY